MSTPQPSMPQAQAAVPNRQPADGSSYRGYTSPIPVVRTHLGNAIASEWTKIRSVRSTIWTLGVFVLLVIGIGVGVAALVAANASPRTWTTRVRCRWGSSGCCSAACASSPSVC